MNSSEPKSPPNLHTKEDYKKALEEYQLRISSILESFTDGFFEVDKDWTVTYWNKATEQLLLKSRDEILGKNLWEEYSEAINLKFFTEYHRAINNNISVRFEEYFPPRDAWLEVAAFPNGNGLSVYFKDITDRKNIIKELELERQKYSDLFNFSPLPQWVYDANSLRFLDVNHAAIEIYGYTREEFLEMTIHQIRPFEDVTVLNKILQLGVVDGSFHSSNVRHKKKNGEILEVLVEGNPVSFEGKKARMVMVIDRTVEILAKKTLEESIARFNLVSQATSDTIWDWNMVNGEIIWNQGIKETFGYNETIYSSQWWRSKVHPKDLLRLIASLRETLKNRESKISLEYRFLGADGSFRSVLDRAFIMFNNDGKPIRMIGSMQDISERLRQIQEIKAQNAKLREISWIQSHKVRGPLSSILGLVDLINESEFAVDGIKELANHLKSAAEDLDEVLRDIVSRT